MLAGDAVAVLRAWDEKFHGLETLDVSDEVRAALRMAVDFLWANAADLDAEVTAN